MEKVKIQYIVNGKEFTSENEAKKYANKLTMNPKYNEGDLVNLYNAKDVIPSCNDIAHYQALLY